MLSPGSLLNIMSTAEGDESDRSISSSQTGERTRDGTSASTVVARARGRRPTAVAACQRCRQRKVKCDSLRPCGPCVAKNHECQYETQAGESRSQASKRKYDEMTRAHDTYTELFHLLRTQNPGEAAEMLRQIRVGQSPEAVIAFAKTGNQIQAVPNTTQAAVDMFLVSLAHSTASAQDITRLAGMVLHRAAQERLPMLTDLAVLRNRFVHIPVVETLLWRASSKEGGLPASKSIQDARNHQKQTMALETARSDHVLGENDEAPDDQQPPHQLSAKPWTSVTTSDGAVSHLVSLFLAWINPTWRFVEQDVFLQGMHSNRLDSDFCSPFLVNSICAIACLHSEHEVAFTSNGRDRITRGQHFHDEALRLWALEEYRPTLTNVQALCVLSLELNYRAKDRVGLTLIPFAVQLDNELPLHGDERRCALQGISKRTFARVRLSAHWTAKCTHIIMRIAFMSPSTITSRLSGRHKIHEVYDDRTEPWVGFPFTKDAVAHRPTLYLVERCKLADLFQEIHDLILANSTVTIRQFARILDELTRKLQQWYRHLPFELQYAWPMSISVWELHASYLASLMILWGAAKTKFEQKKESPERKASPDEHDDSGDDNFRSIIAKEKLSGAILIAHRAATILRDFRERYGLKVTPAWLLQLQAVTAGVLLQDPELADPTMITSPAANTSGQAIQNSHVAFDEVFRCLIGTGVEVMIARGIARMMYHTALERNIALSSSTRSLLQLMSSTAWRPSDLRLVSSAFPNYADAVDHERGGRLSELLSKWEKLEI